MIRDSGGLYAGGRDYTVIKILPFSPYFYGSPIAVVGCRLLRGGEGLLVRGFGEGVRVEIWRGF